MEKHIPAGARGWGGGGEVEREGISKRGADLSYLTLPDHGEWRRRGDWQDSDHDDSDSTQVGLSPKGTRHEDTSCYYYWIYRRTKGGWAPLPARSSEDAGGEREGAWRAAVERAVRLSLPHEGNGSLSTCLLNSLVASYWSSFLNRHKWMTSVLQFILWMIGRLHVFCSSLIGLLQRKTMVNGAQQEYLFCFRTYPCFIIIIHF
jgi:hypothetical protein